MDRVCLYMNLCSANTDGTLKACMSLHLAFWDGGVFLVELWMAELVA